MRFVGETSVGIGKTNNDRRHPEMNLKQSLSQYDFREMESADKDLNLETVNC